MSFDRSITKVRKAILSAHEDVSFETRPVACYPTFLKDEIEVASSGSDPEKSRILAKFTGQQGLPHSAYRATH